MTAPDPTLEAKAIVARAVTALHFEPTVHAKAHMVWQVIVRSGYYETVPAEVQGLVRLAVATALVIEDVAQ